MTNIDKKSDIDKKSNEELAEATIEKLLAFRSGSCISREGDHLEADELLLDLLTDLGYGNVADAWRKARETVRFWYS